VISGYVVAAVHGQSLAPVLVVAAGNVKRTLLDGASREPVSSCRDSYFACLNNADQEHFGTPAAMRS
jgi:hypothetical protein